MSETRTYFRDMAEKLFAGHCTQTIIDAAEAGTFPRALWDALDESGILSMLLPEAEGGIGASLADAGEILRAAGGHVAPGPIVDTLVARRCLAAAKLSIPPGPLGLVFLEERGLRAGSQRWTPPAAFPTIPWARDLAAIVLVAESDGASLIAPVKPTDLSFTPDNAAASEPSGKLSAQAVEIKATAAASELYRTMLRTAALLRGAQMVGALEWVLARSSEYALERKQFGRPIGRFQAVQHELAELAGHVVGASTMTDAALVAGADGETEPLVAAARARIGDAVDAAVTIGHQVHGAIGFSRAYSLNFRTRRLMVWRDTFGSVPYWRRVLARSFIGLSADEVWPKVTAVQSSAVS